MTQQRLLLTGISARGRHGATTGEQDHPQDFVVDVDALVDVDADSIEATADYRAVVGAVIEAVEQGSVVLLESLAAKVAEAVYELERVERVTVRVHKPRAAARLSTEDVAAEASAG